MTNERLEQIRQRAEAATRGPWEHWRHGCIVATVAGMRRQVAAVLGDAVMHADPGVTAEEIREVNAAFLGHARADVPDLLAEVERLNGILHDANSTPLSEVASELAALRENVVGTAALLHESEAEVERLRKKLVEYDADYVRGRVAVYCYAARRIESLASEIPEPDIVRALNALAKELRTYTQPAPSQVDAKDAEIASLRAKVEALTRTSAQAVVDAVATERGTILRNLNEAAAEISLAARQVTGPPRILLQTGAHALQIAAEEIRARG